MMSKKINIYNKTWAREMKTFTFSLKLSFSEKTEMYES